MCEERCIDKNRCPNCGKLENWQDEYSEFDLQSHEEHYMLQQDYLSLKNLED